LDDEEKAIKEADEFTEMVYNNKRNKEDINYDLFQFSVA
jgi:hypothetical protein